MANDLNNPLSGIRDNYRRGSVGDFLKEKIRSGAALSIISAYFTISAYAALKDELGSIANLRFLFGEPRFVRQLDPDKTDTKTFVITEEGLQLQNQLQQKRVAKECADWIQAKAEIKSVKQAGLLHGKMYHMAANGVEEAIMGSSNFTLRGLGLGRNSNNIELNLEVDGNRDRRDLKHWFDELWNDTDLVADVKDEVLSYLAQLYQNNSPEFIYYKTLYHLFEQYLSDQQRADLFDLRSQIIDTDIWKALFEFQKDGVKGAINKILTHNGCILADSVGLGKTYEALAVIKYFELRNFKALVLCPKKLRDNWTVYLAQNNSALNPFVRDRFAYTVLSHTDLSREGGYSGDINLGNVNWGNYDLVVIDESHNFRNNTPGKRDEDGNVIRQSRYERLMDDIIKSGVKTRVLLLSATPVNNDLKDLRNQIYFITGGEDAAFRETLSVGSIQETLRAAQLTFNEWAKRNRDKRDVRDLMERLSPAVFTLLDELTIARSRKHIQKFYADVVIRLGGFPRREKPISIYSEIDLKDRFMAYDRLNDEILKYQLSLFNPSRYVLAEHKTKYEKKAVVEQFTQSQRENYLIGMMKVGFLKRLESSVNSFAITMRRTIEKIEDLQERIKRFQQLKQEKPELDFDDLKAMAEAEDDDDLRAALEVGKKLTFRMEHLRLDDWLKDLKKDKDQLNGLYLAARDVTADRDAKLAELKRLIAAKARQPTTNKLGRPNRKVLVFTAYADTAAYLYDSLKDWARNELDIHLALVTGGSRQNATTFGKNEFQYILTNFAPLAKRRAQMGFMPQDDEIDLLIATDCISEGQNLQDCDTVVNYDIHWNPVRIIQRFGRIDRIGSLSQSVQLVNFWPTKDLDRYISLKARVEARMALVDITATQDDNLLTDDQIADDLRYRDRQLLKLKDEVLDLEDFNETLALNEFTLDDFRIDLSNYIESNRRLLEEAPLGLYAVAPPAEPTQIIRPGVIYCLRQKGETEGSEVVNPLRPYFLVYIYADGTVRFSFAQPKQILDTFRLLCAGKTAPYDDLCALFDQQTQNGADLSFYDDLLRKAVVSIENTFKKKAAGNLLASRGGVLPEQSKQARETTDFDLITWLVIRST